MPPPRAALFLGPQSVGKWTLAEELAGIWEVPNNGVVRVRTPTMDNARSVTSLAFTTAPRMRLFIIQLDGSSSEFQAALLKTLEESHDSNHFLLISTEAVSTTIMSRCDIYRFSPLSDEQVEKVLVSRNFGPTRAKLLSHQSGGSVRKALDLHSTQDTKVLVLAALRAISLRDESALDTLATQWSEEHTGLLEAVCMEKITGRWRVFSATEVDDYSKRMMLSIIGALSSGRNVRPRLMVRYNLMSLLRGTS